MRTESSATDSCVASCCCCALRRIRTRIVSCKGAEFYCSVNRLFVISLARAVETSGKSSKVKGVERQGTNEKPLVG